MSPVAPRLLSVDRLLLHGGRSPHTRHTGSDAAKQRTVVYLSGRGRGNRCFCGRELITIVTPLSQPGSAKTAASVCLYSVPVYRKQERSLFTAALEQTSNVPTAIIRPRPTAGLWSPIPSIRRPGHCPPFHAPIPPATSTDCPGCQTGGGGGDSPARRPGADGRCTSPVALPRTLPPDGFQRATAGYVDRPQTGWGPVIGRERRRVRPMIAPPPFAPPPAIQLRPPR